MFPFDDIIITAQSHRAPLHQATYDIDYIMWRHHFPVESPLRMNFQDLYNFKTNIFLQTNTARSGLINTMWHIYTVWCRYNAVNFLTNFSQKTPHSSPVRSRYRVSFVGPAPDRYSARVPTIMYAISYYIGSCYNGTQLYLRNLWNHHWFI